MNKNRNAKYMSMLSLHSVWCVIFIVVPLLFVLYYTFTDEQGHLTMGNFLYLGTPEILKCFGISIAYALAATVVCLLLAYPLAMVIANIPAKNRSLATLLVMLPMWVSFIIRTYTLKNLFNDNGIINQLLEAFVGLLKNIPAFSSMDFTPIRFIGTSGLIILGMVYDFFPYMVMPIVNVLTGIDPRLHEAAYDLGCTPWTGFLRVTLPLSRSGIVSGITMVFVPAVSTFYISSTLSGGLVSLVGDKIEAAFLTEGNFNRGSALSFVLMILILLSLFVMNRFGDKESEELAP
ncbi:MAG: ABC transporter permease [Clostridia bacterium]|nr:ABC transporter permease [Clostridia bacterium]